MVGKKMGSLGLGFNDSCGKSEFIYKLSPPTFCVKNILL